jgi:hypothetical protein
MERLRDELFPIAVRWMRLARGRTDGQVARTGRGCCVWDLGKDNSSGIARTWHAPLLEKSGPGESSSGGSHGRRGRIWRTAGHESRALLRSHPPRVGEVRAMGQGKATRAQHWLGAMVVRNLGATVHAATLHTLRHVTPLQRPRV